MNFDSHQKNWRSKPAQYGHSKIKVAPRETGIRAAVCNRGASTARVGIFLFFGAIIGFLFYYTLYVFPEDIDKTISYSM